MMKTVSFGRMVDSAVICVALAAVTSLYLPVLLKKRAASREALCQNNLKQIGLGYHNYHSAYKALPPGMGGTTAETTREKSNAGQLGPLAGLLPFVEAQATWELIANPYQNPETGQEFPPMGPVPWYSSEKYLPWAMAPKIYVCPTSQPSGETTSKVVIQGWTSRSNSFQGGITSYAACFGDGTQLLGQIVDATQASNVHRRYRASARGAFRSSGALKFRDFLDGLSNTILYSEVVASHRRLPGKSEVIRDVKGISLDPSQCLAAMRSGGQAFWGFGRGASWAHGAPVMSGFQTVLPPNSPSCTSELGVEDVIASASSLHSGGVHVLMADGAVTFISETIDCGDSSAAGVSVGDGYGLAGSGSPYGLWGALGSRASAENVAGRSSRNRSRSLTTDTPDGNPSGRFRSWTDKSGKKRLNAEFIEIVDQKTVRLRSVDGNVHEIPLNDFGDRDVMRLVDEDLNRLGQ